MFNLFGSKKESKQDYPAIVHEIHNEFLTAGDKILEEANAILSEAKAKSVEKGKRLAAAGFKNVPEAVEAINVERKIITTKETADLVHYYQQNYPLNKFITENQVKKICEKYGLVCGEISMYKGFVPENKLSEIERFKLKKEDKETIFIAVGNGGKSELPRYFITEQDFTEEGIKYFIKNGNRGYVTGPHGEGIYSEKLFTEKCLNDFRGHLFVEFAAGERTGANFYICAPLKDMEIPRGKEVKGYKIQDIPDPVVLQPVKGGYLIVAAWGDEASDEIVVNQINN